MKRPNLSPTQRTNRYYQKQLDRGFVEIRIWVPKGQIEKFKQLARDAREEFKNLMDI